MTRRRALFLPAIVAALAWRPLAAQGGGATVADSVAVEGNRRVARETVLLTAGLAPGRPVSYREVQQAIQNLYASGQFDDVVVERRELDGRTVLVLRVRERPLLVRWTLRGVERVGEGAVRDKVQLIEGRPLDPAVLERSRARIDSLYRARGYALARVSAHRSYDADSTQVRVTFQVDEGRRVAIAQVTFEGNTRFSDEELAAQIKSKPEGFFWFRSGELDDDELQRDLLERLPQFYGERGYVDFQVLGDTVVVEPTTGKASLVIRVSEGDPYRVGSFEVVGNRRFSTEELESLYPFRGETAGRGFLGLFGGDTVRYFNQERWEKATNEVRTAYFNNGYIYAQVRPDVLRRTDAQGRPVVDLRWVIQEGQPAIVNRVEIVGNDVTHERVIREAIVLLPGDVFRQDALIRSYQNISNLGFFNQPLPPPDTRPVGEAGDVDVIFHVSEKRTGNINFGASVGQGTGLGGFLGLDEPNLFGQGKRGRFQWQFGKNINDFDLSFTDPAIRESRVSGTISVHNTRLRYRIGDLGRLRRRGASLQLGFPLFNDRYTRLFVSYGVDQQTFTGSASNQDFRRRFGCTDCVRSTVGLSVLRDTRIDLPFATAGSMAQASVSQSGGILGGRGNFQRVDLESRWYAPLGQLGGQAGGGGVRFVLGLSSRAGFVFGNSPFFEQLFFMGGTQFGIPLRGYDEFSITPKGFDPNATTGQATSADAFGKAYYAMTGEIGARLSQMFYVSAFVDAGNLWARPSEFNPTRLFRGAGLGIAVISPLGPIGIDYAYGFDRTDLNGRPAPGWKLHFKLGNFF
ncbi:MAG TPA: outer membrane protein assembly factor BamA [Gemmatimonadales bacterium]|nr:outer membrane protein assembly factor BamA [Gemmatimonadales bacterium]